MQGVRGSRCHWMQMNGAERQRERETGRNVSGCQKSRLNLWLIERDFSRVDANEWKSWMFSWWQTSRWYRYSCPWAIGYNPIVPLVFPARCSASSSATSNLFHECLYPRTNASRLATLPSTADFLWKSKNSRDFTSNYFPSSTPANKRFWLVRPTLSSSEFSY